MASYEQIAKRLQRLEARQIAPVSAGPSHAEDIARWQRLLKEHEWSEPGQVLIQQMITWHQEEGASGHVQKAISPAEGQQVKERIEAKFKQMIARLSDADLDTLRGALEQEVAQDAS